MYRCHDTVSDIHNGVRQMVQQRQFFYNFQQIIRFCNGYKNFNTTYTTFLDAALHGFPGGFSGW